jgi:glycosyltransferase involved in cell wall biosynthesis
MNDKGQNRKSGMASRRIKVLQLISQLPVGGAEDLVAAIVRGLNPQLFQVQAATIGPLGQVGEELRKDGFEVVSLDLDLKRTPFCRLVLEVRGLLTRIAPDILHTHLYHPNLYGRLAALGLPLKGVVASVHNSYNRVKLHRALWNFLLSFTSHRILVSSLQVWQDVRRLDRVPERKLEILPYGVKLESLEIPISRQEAKNTLGLSGFVVGTVGRLEEQKGHRYLLAALPELSRRLPDLAVLLVGEGREAAALRSQARELGVGHLVHFLGTRRDLGLVLRAMDVFVQPSLWEGLPLALLLAMGAGLPVVGTRVSGISEVIFEGVNGLLVPPKDSAALARAILELHSRPDKREQWGRAAKETVTRHYSQEAMLRRLEGLYLALWEGKDS